ncbi:MAG: transcription termination/antitermination protein NusG [Lachnospiraceae bacterium]|nr:transcription termination/antitermination protein NusG [Lachnospiraceae bacterium]
MSEANQMSEMTQVSEAKWYVIHTYSGYENKVKANIEKTVANRHLEDKILDVRVPLEEVQETRGGVTKMVQRKMFPGYVIVNMEMDDDTWYVVRNTRGVTGFVGPGSKPVPLTPDEMWSLGLAGGDMPTAQKPKIVVDFEIGDMVVVIAGAWNGTEGAIQDINPQKQTVTITVELFGRDTPVEINFAEVKKK